MQLASVRIVAMGPFEDLTIRLGDPTEGERPRALTVVLGGAGVGKTTLLTAIAATRPGHAIAHPRGGWAVTEWMTGDDDRARPHPLKLVTPNAPPESDAEETATARRREQVVFDRRATEGGYVLVALSGARWFSRAPLLLSAPERSLARYDVRAAASFDDATRADLARETKQVLAYAAISGALGGLTRVDTALRGALAHVLAPFGYEYKGVDPRTLEPTFDPGPLSFDELPTAVRHAIAMVALPMRALFAAYPDGEDPRSAEGVVLVDDVDRHLDPSVQRTLLPTLREALPRVQWIVTTSSPLVAEGCAANEVLALRRLELAEKVELFAGDLARLH